MNYSSLSIVIPAYNEGKTLTNLLAKVVAVDFGGIKREIIIIDDGSKDKTGELAKGFAAKHKDKLTSFKVLRNDPNRGKTQTVKRGVLESTGDLVVVQDADLEYEPEELKEFVEMFQNDAELDVVYGNRFGKKNKVIYWQNYFGNKFLTTVSNFFTGWKGFWLSDMEVCYKMARGEVFRDVAQYIVSTSNFGLEPEVTARFAKYKKPSEKGSNNGRGETGKRKGKRSGLKLRQIPISYYPRSIEEGKHMKAYRDGMKALGEILKFNLTGK